MFLESRARLGRRADNLTAICLDDVGSFVAGIASFLYRLLQDGVLMLRAPDGTRSWLMC
jgi:hypothetical protein